MLIEDIAEVTQHLMKFFIPEIVFIIFVERSGKRFKFRFSGIEGHPGLKPFAKTWAVGAVAFIAYIFSTPIFEFLLGTTIDSWLISLGLINLLLLTISLSAFTFLFIVNYLLGKKLDKYSGIVGAITVISFFIFYTRVSGNV